MAATRKDPVLVVLQLSGGNDYFNTVIPYTDPLYRDNRPAVGIPDDQILHLDKAMGLHPAMSPIKKLYEDGKVAIIHGAGYANSPRSHFRSMDIWHTCEPDKVIPDGWLGRAIREIDPNKDNVVTAVSFGPSLFRALVAPGVPVACVGGPLESYGLLPGIQGETQRAKILDRFARMYSPVVGRSTVMEYLGTTGLDSMKGADILKVAPQKYASTVKYPDTSIAKKLRGISQVHLAELGTRVFYCDHGSFDTHASQNPSHGNLWKDVSDGIEAFFTDLRDHKAADNVIMLLFSEFGRRVHDNGSGTDHGAAGACFVIGEKVKGGQYGEYPSRKAEDLVQGDLNPTMDFRSVYSTIAAQWMKLDAQTIVGGTFEQPAFLKN
ncbi:MAG: DUF1501 domain-containing protein [Nitrospinae bacterium]|nr:DUF1501 domain-containing protein [Nitrospinota bacterium]